MRYRAVRPTPPASPAGSASALAMLRDPRMLWIYDDRTEFRRPEGDPALPITVVVTVKDAKRLADTLRSLAMQRYRKFSVILVGLSPKLNDAIKELAGAYKQFLPEIRLFLLRSAGWAADGLNGALSLIATRYWCWVRAGDVIHDSALQLLAGMIEDTHCDYYSTCRASLQPNLIVKPDARPTKSPTLDRLWAGHTFPYGPLITYSTAAVASVKGFVSYDQYPGDTAWIMAYKLARAGCQFQHINAVVYFKHTRDETKHETVTPAQYRRSLILNRWPEQYVEDTSES